MIQGVAQLWLKLHVQAVPGVRRGVLITSPGVNSETAAHFPLEEPYDDLAEVAREALQTRRTVVRARRAQRSAPAAMSEISIPFGDPTSGGGAVAVEVVHARGWDCEPSCKSVVDLLMSGASWLEGTLRETGASDRMGSVLRAVGVALEHANLGGAAAACTTHLASELGCERVALGMLRAGRIQLEALSFSADFDTRSSLVVDLGSAMEEAVDQDAALRFPAPPDAPPRVLLAHEALLRQHGAALVQTVPLAQAGECVGALSFEWTSARRPDARALALCTDVAMLLGPVLSLTRAAAASPGARVAEAAEDYWRTLRRPGHVSHKLGWLAATAAGVFLMLGTGTYRVSAPAALEGRVQRAVVASFEGYVAEARTRAGDVVEAGELLARLDERDLLLERRRWEGRGAQLDREYREALAAHDRSGANVLRAQITQARAELALVGEKLSRTRLVAPFDGVVVKGDLSQALGSPVERGEVLFEIAPLDGYRIILQVDERDIADLRPGQSGRLTLSALPDHVLPLSVERVIPVSVSEDGRNAFRVEASLDGPAPGLRPGMEGVGKIEIGERRWIWIRTRELVHWLRMWTWQWTL